MQIMVPNVFSRVKSRELFMIKFYKCFSYTGQISKGIEYRFYYNNQRFKGRKHVLLCFKAKKQNK